MILDIMFVEIIRQTGRSSAEDEALAENAQVLVAEVAHFFSGHAKIK